MIKLNITYLNLHFVENKGFNKIDVASQLQRNTAVNSTPLHIKKKKFPSFKSRKAKIITSIILLLILIFGYVFVNALIFLGDAKKTYAQTKLTYDAIKKQNIALASEELIKTQKSVKVLKKDLSPIAFVGYIPLLGGYYNDAYNLISASEHGVNAALITVDSLIPYADVLGLKGEKSFAQGSAEDRIRLAVQTMGKVVSKIDEIEKEVAAAQISVSKINPNRYPSIGPFKKVHDQLANLKDVANGGVVAVQEGKPLIKLLPELLGEKDEKKYLVLFQNDKELRPTGGFITFYAIFRVDKGIIKVDKSGDIYTLDESLRKHEKAPPIIAKYLPKVSTFNIRDSNLSPDFVESMKQFNEMYELSSDKTKIDGIIALDTQFLVSVLKVLGEVEAGGLKFNAEKDKRCDCPQVVYTLENEITRPVNYVKSNRKGLLADLLYATMQKALSSSPKLYWGNLTQAAINDAHQKHIMFYLFNKDAQRGIEALNWAGRVKDFKGGYLYINDANFGGAKSNLFVDKTVRVDFDINKNGEITNKLTISYKNPEPHSDCDLETGGLCLNATLRNFQRVYVPVGSTLESSKGSQVKVETKKEFGKTYFEAFLTVNPQGSAKITYEYKLPFKVEGKTMPLFIQKQPGTEGDPYEIYVNARLFDSFNLTTDRELSIPVK